MGERKDQLMKIIVQVRTRSITALLICATTQTGLTVNFNGHQKLLVAVKAERFKGIRSEQYRPPTEILDAMELRMTTGSKMMKVECLFGTLTIMRNLPNVHTQFQGSGGRLLLSALVSFPACISASACASPSTSANVSALSLCLSVNRSFGV